MSKLFIFPHRTEPDEHEAPARAFGEEIAAAINSVRKAGVPQGFVVAVLHAHAQQETGRLYEDALPG